MDDLKNDINNKLKLLEQLIADNANAEEIEKTRKELDELLNEYIKDFD